MNAMNKQKLLMILVLVLVVVTFIWCTLARYVSSKAGFLSGLWHGFIILFSLVGKLFGFKVGLYALHNSDFTYCFVYIIGIGAFGCG
jgi:hypothetical protein